MFRHPKPVIEKIAIGKDNNIGRLRAVFMVLRLGALAFFGRRFGRCVKGTDNRPGEARGNDIGRFTDRKTALQRIRGRRAQHIIAGHQTGIIGGGDERGEACAGPVQRPQSTDRADIQAVNITGHRIIAIHFRRPQPHPQNIIGERAARIATGGDALGALAVSDNHIAKHAHTPLPHQNRHIDCSE